MTKPCLRVLSRYSRLGASSRLRTLQYRHYLEEAGFDIEYEALFDDAYLHNLYAGSRDNTALLRYYFNRLASLRRKPAPDLIWLEKELLPWVPWLVEKTLLPRGIPIAVDYDDAVFHRYDRHRLSLLRHVLGKKIDRVMERSALVTAGNGYLAERAAAAGARHIKHVPTVVNLDLYEITSERRTSALPKIGWIGSPSTWDEYMVPLMPMYANIASHHNARILAVGGRDAMGQFGGVLDTVAWTEETEVSRIQEMDIGVMPLTDTPWERGKCGYKLIQYMACGVPVVASPIGVNAEIVEHGVNGFLVTTEAEWTEALEVLLLDRELRWTMGMNGRRKVEKEYSLQNWGPRVARMMNDLAERGIKG